MADATEFALGITSRDVCLKAVTHFYLVISTVGGYLVWYLKYLALCNELVEIGWRASAESGELLALESAIASLLPIALGSHGKRTTQPWCKHQEFPTLEGISVVPRVMKGSSLKRPSQFESLQLEPTVSLTANLTWALVTLASWKLCTSCVTCHNPHSKFPNKLHHSVAQTWALWNVNCFIPDTSWLG